MMSKVIDDIGSCVSIIRRIRSCVRDSSKLLGDEKSPVKNDIGMTSHAHSYAHARMTYTADTPGTSLASQLSE